MKKTSRIINILLVITLLINMFIPMSYANTNSVATLANPVAYDNWCKTNPYWSKTNAPTIYGTTGIKVPSGTTIDYEHDARFRVFAKDNEDGDITSKIVATDNLPSNYTSIDSGNYTITYTVTDSDNNTTTINVPVEIRSSKEIELQKTMYSLPSVDHLNTLGYTRGNNMDRQTIGIFVEAGASFEMKKLSTGNMTVKLERNDSVQESQKVLSTNNEWTTIKNVITSNGTELYYDSVPSVKTLYKETSVVTYDVKWDSTDARIKPLHYYHEGDGLEYQDKFMAEWEKDENSYAMIDGLSMMVLVPYQDHDHMFYEPYPGGKPYDSFEHFLSWWNDIMDEYDELIGLSYEPDVCYNQNVKTKYFVKANAHGAGAAYYNGSDHVGINSTSDWSMFQVGWGGLHEVGHGYQGNLNGGGLGMPLTEVGVNIGGYYIQDVVHKFIYNESWLNVKGREKEYNNARLQGYGYYDNGDGNIGAAAMLYSLVNALDYFEDFSQTKTHGYKEANDYINKYFRKHYFETGEKLQTADAWCLALAEKYGVNFVLYFESWGATVSDSVKEQLMATDAELVYFLRDLVGDDATATSLKPSSNVGIYDLVTTSELNKLSKNSINSDIELTFKIDDMSQIKGKTIYIADGDTIVKKVKLSDENLSDGNKIKVNLPVGAYKVAVPKPDGVYDFDNLYVLVTKGKTDKYDVVYNKINDISFGNDIIITARGYWGVDYHPFIVQVVGNQMKFDYQDTYPRSGMVNNQTLFASLTVYDTNNNIVYEKTTNGGYYDTFVDDKITQVLVDVQKGYKLKIYYAGDVTDVTFTSSLTGKGVDGYNIPTNNHTRTYVVTEYGLIPEDILGDYPNSISDEAYNAYKDRLDEYIEDYKKGKTQDELLDPFSPNKGSNVIKNALKNLTEADQAKYNEKLKSISTGEAPEIKSSENKTSYEFDLANDAKRTIEEVYAMITVTDKEDGTIYENSALTAKAKQLGATVEFNSDVNWEQVGTYHVTITATDSHDNITTLVLEVVIIDTDDEEVIDISNFEAKIEGNDFVYTGEEITPSVKVVDSEGHILTEGTDYQVTYSNNKNAGTATITITAIEHEKDNGSNYTGSITLTFTIKKAEPQVIPSTSFVVENDIDNTNEISLPEGWSWKNGNTALAVGDNKLTLVYKSNNINYKDMELEVVVTRKEVEKIEPEVTPEPPTENPDDEEEKSSGQPWGEDNPNHGGDFTEDPAGDVGPNDDGNGVAKDPNGSNNDDKKDEENNPSDNDQDNKEDEEPGESNPDDDKKEEEKPNTGGETKPEEDKKEDVPNKNESNKNNSSSSSSSSSNQNNSSSNNTNSSSSSNSSSSNSNELESSDKEENSNDKNETNVTDKPNTNKNNNLYGEKEESKEEKKGIIFLKNFIKIFIALILIILIAICMSLSDRNKKIKMMKK